MPKKALLLMNMGGATTKEELRMFLLNMFHDPNILTIRSDFFRGLLAKLIVNKRLDTSWANYERIGGSPLPRITDELVAKLTEKIGNDYLILPVMCYTKPGNKEAIAKLKKGRITDITLFPLYPHYSSTTVKSSVGLFLSELKKSGVSVILNETEGSEESRISGKEYHIGSIEPFYTDESYNQVIIERIQEALQRTSPILCHAEFTKHLPGDTTEQILPSSEGQKPKVQNLEPENTILLFSAHGLPEKIIQKGDPYQKQVEEHVEILSRMLSEKGVNFKQIKLAYQSRIGPMKWIGPSLEETLQTLKGERILVYPISFTIDNSETIYELHHEYFEHAKRFGISAYEVCDCPNTSEKFVESIIRMLHTK